MTFSTLSCSRKWVGVSTPYMQSTTTICPSQAGRSFYEDEAKGLGTNAASLRAIGVEHDRHIQKKNLAWERNSAKSDTKSTVKSSNRIVSLERAKQRRTNSRS